MTLNDRDDRRHGGVPADAACAERPASPLVLELVIAGTEPLSGTVRAAGGEVPIAFHGWIDLMSALSSLGAGSRAVGD
jgi:hypothetical protein